MSSYRTLHEVTEAYFREHPDEIEDFLAENFAEYARDGDSAALLSALRIIARVKGISQLAEDIGMSRQGLQKALSGKGNPRLESINAIMRALGYYLAPQKLENLT